MVSEELFNNNNMILYMLTAQGQGNTINVKKIAFGNKELTTKLENGSFGFIDSS